MLAGKHDKHVRCGDEESYSGGMKDFETRIGD